MGSGMANGRFRRPCMNGSTDPVGAPLAGAANRAAVVRSRIRNTFSPTGPGPYGLGGNSALTSALDTAVARFLAGHPSTVALAVTGGTLGLGDSTSGTGAPGPVAGAGLPFLALAYAAWRRRRARAIA